jgi:hypothetical protein
MLPASDLARLLQACISLTVLISCIVLEGSGFKFDINMSNLKPDPNLSLKQYDN